MLIFNHPLIKSPKFYKIKNIDDIIDTPPNSIILLSPLPHSIEIVKYCKKNLIPFAIETDSIKYAIFANIFKAKYIITSKELAKELVPIAQNYLFDTQIIAKIINEDEIEEMAKVGVDAVFIKNQK